MTSAPDPVPSLAADTVIDLERQYLLQNYSRYPLVVHRGKGCHVYDVNGTRYLDFIAGIGVNALEGKGCHVYDVNGTRYLDFIAGIGVNALGHAHPRIVKVIRDHAVQIGRASR